jgi:hypothetical protein
MSADAGEQRRRRRPIGIFGILVEAFALWLRSGRVGGHVVVRCRSGHLYTTIWLPGVSLKSARLGWWRLQFCPVGRHVSLVSPVRESELSARQRRVARRRTDLRIP